ncbi:hypothetical protein [uncultured Cohaesibacter sp.]|uniref:hypothetical protein n=1 Tax=uncultured Cohaesibacter sp. TaxID=1002546 RepID=UPI002AAB1B69|nr:hypothetical protein [uncultured Cohaesibacter sp.]
MISSLVQRLCQLIGRHGDKTLPPADVRRSASLSPLLQDGAKSPYVRVHSRRLFWVSGVLFALCLLSAATLLKLWPDVAPFDSIYRFHDDVWLSLKGRLWTAWFPWSLILWVPVVALVGLGVGMWTSGKDPSRPLHRLIILFLSGLLRLRLAGKAEPSAGLLQTVVHWSQKPGLRSDYMELVIRHALDHQFEQMEAAVLAGRQVDVAWLRRADRLMRARALFPAKEVNAGEGNLGEAEARWLEAFFDLAFLSHIDTDQDVAVADYLADLMKALGPEESQKFALLDAFVAARPLSSCQYALWQALAGFDQLSASASAQIEQMRRVPPASGRIPEFLAPCAFAFLAVADRNWALASLTALSSIERAYNALRLSGDYQQDADALAWWIGRSRLATIRLLHQRSHQTSLSADDLALWPDERPVYHPLTGSRLAAGGV